MTQIAVGRCWFAIGIVAAVAIGVGVWFAGAVADRRR
jgi:hypothetical protein